MLDEYSLLYWLDFGTLLGAIREGRRLAWEFEFDLGMFKQDYDPRSDLWLDFKKLGYVVQKSEWNIKLMKYSEIIVIKK